MVFRSPQVTALTLSLAMAAMGARAADSFPGENGDDPLDAKPVCISGVYPHLAALGGSGNEFGIGVVVPWAGRLWFKTYSAGGPGNLYSVGPDLDLRVERKGIGGLGSRLIHRESNQLFITSCAIDASGNVRDLRAQCGRHTAAMRHLTDPANKIYLFGMEGDFVEVDVQTLDGERVFRVQDKGVTGAHGKGGYTGQGRVIVANNGCGGGLAEWDGKVDRPWTTIEREQFCDVTGPGGIYGAASEGDPVWATGWDRRSVILKVLDKGKWHTYRLPKGSYTHDAEHGWFTEWPRIRGFAPGRLMMNMHGMIYDFPEGFRPGQAGGLRPIATHLYMSGDWCNWNGRVVIGRDDTAGFGNPLCGHAQSNLWFGQPEDLHSFGKPAGWGGPWIGDDVKAGEASDPFLISGFDRRVLHLSLSDPHQEQHASRMMRTTDQLAINDISRMLTALPRVTIHRGDYHKPAPGYTFTVNRPIVVYLAVDVRGSPDLGPAWSKTDLTLTWGGVYRDVVYKREFAAGLVEIPGNDTEHKPSAFGMPHTAFVASDATDLKIEPAKIAAVTLPTAIPTKELGAIAEVRFTLEVDASGKGEWEKHATVEVPAAGYVYHIFPKDLDAQWIRITADKDCCATAYFHYSSSGGPADEKPRHEIARSLVAADNVCARSEGSVIPHYSPDGLLHFRAQQVDNEGRGTEAGLYQVDTHLNIAPAANAAASSSKVPQLNVPSAPSSRYLLPRPADPSPYDAAAERGWRGRTRREVVTERDLLNYQGTIYEVPRHGGIARARPITSHGKLISDFCSWRGLLVLAGTRADAKPDGHYFRCKDDKTGLWFGFVEDLWHFGKPRGVGGPWKDSPVQAGKPSAAYIMTGFDRKSLELSHNADKDVTFTIEVDFLATGQWHRYATFEVAPGETVRHRFPDGYSAHWVRAITDTDCSATAWFTYD